MESKEVKQIWVYIQSEFQNRDGSDLFTVGFYDNGRWNPESDYATKEEAGARANYLNGGIPEDVQAIKSKAKKYDEIEALVSACYPENESDSDADLCTIGEKIANYFGYL